MRHSIWTPIIVATLVCGTLDILFAVMLTLVRGIVLVGLSTAYITRRHLRA